MPDFDETDYEERLRRALHDLPTPVADADTVLGRVEHGVRRRVRRRRLGTATLGVAAVMTAAAVVIPTLSEESTVADGPQRPDHESSKRLRPDHLGGSATAGIRPRQKGIGTPKKARRPGVGKTATPTNLAVSDIAVNSSGDVGVIGKSTCPDGPCIVAGSPAEGVDFRVAPPNSHRLEKMKLSSTETVGGMAPGIELGSDPSNWWAWTDALYATHDSGKTWKAVRLPDSMSVTGVKSDNSRVWAFGVRTNGRSGVASADQRKNNWAREPVPVGAGESIETPMIIDGHVAFIASARKNPRSAFVRRSGSGWTRSSVPCPAPVKSTSANSTVWLGCTTPTDDQLVAWSHDDGDNWQMTLIERPGLSAVGGVNSTTAIVGVGTDMVRVNADTGRVTPVGAPPFTSSDDVWGDEVGYATIRFDSNGTGWATTTGGALGRSDDGGRTWQPTPLS
ncbi:MAG: hypothetical protein L0K86_09275 [Actinomycetia bacterium]|nr:hypothetical protein [Actinomycetes bacterium]